MIQTQHHLLQPNQQTLICLWHQDEPTIIKSSFNIETHDLQEQWLALQENTKAHTQT